MMNDAFVGNTCVPCDTLVSPPEERALVSILNLSGYFSLFSKRTSPPVLTKLATKHPLVKGNLDCLCLLSKGDDCGIVKLE